METVERRDRLDRVRERIVEAIGRLRTASGRLTANAVEQTASIAEIAAGARASVARIAEAREVVETADRRTRDADEELASAEARIAELSASTGEAAGITKEALASLRELLGLTARIDGIVAFVRDLSERTNLLALNASIEAARAGIHGRGFAVVAAEVRKLAESTRDATRDVEKLLGEIAARGSSTGAFGTTLDAAVARGERSAREARGALEAISRAVREVSTAFAGVDRLMRGEAEAVEQAETISNELLGRVREHFADTAEAQLWIANVEFQRHELSALHERCGLQAFSARPALRVGCAVSPDSLPGRWLREFARRVAALAGGDLAVELVLPYQKRPTEMLIELRTGELSMAAMNCSLIGSLVPEAQLLELPMLFASRAHAYAVLDGPFGAHVLRQGELVDLTFLAYSENGLRHFTNDVRPIRGPEDMRDLRMRTLEGPIPLYMASALRMTPFPLSFVALYQALADKRVDGQDNPLPSIVSAKLYEHQRYLTLSGHTYTPQVVVANPEVLEALGTRRAAVEQAVRETVAWQRREAAKADAEALALLRRHCEVVELGPAERAAFAATLAPVYARAADLVGEEHVAAVRRAAAA